MNPRNNTGFTLIELVIALTIGILLFLVATSMYLTGQNTYRHTDTKAELTQNGRVILDRLIREVRQTNDLVTEIPETNDDPEALPAEIMFQDGHDVSQIRYVRYYLDGSEIKRQVVIYYFDEAPELLVHWYDTDDHGNLPTMSILEDRVIGEFVDDLEFWGDQLINVNLYLLKDGQSEIANTTVYGRNL